MVRFEKDLEKENMVVFFTGKMDTLSAEALMKTVMDNLPKGDFLQTWKVVFDLAEVDFISSYFIRICISVAKLASQGNFSIVNSQPIVKRTFQISGLNELLRVQ